MATRRDRLTRAVSLSAHSKQCYEVFDRIRNASQLDLGSFLRLDLRLAARLGNMQTD